MEELISLVALGGDSAVLVAIMGFGYHRLATRLTAIESALKAKE